MSGGVGIFAEGATERRASIANSIYRKRVEHTALPTIQELADSEPAIGLAFQPGIPASDVFPRLVWSRPPKRHDQRIDQSALDYAQGGGYAHLRQAIAAYLVGSITWRAVHSGSDRGRDLSRAATALVWECRSTTFGRVGVIDRVVGSPPPHLHEIAPRDLIKPAARPATRTGRISKTRPRDEQPGEAGRVSA
jgi:hypothetical protein